MFGMLPFERSDDNLFALKDGKVKFERLGKDRKQVSIVEEIAQ